MSNPYVIFVGVEKDDMQPIVSAPDKESAINEAIQLQATFPYTEAIYMPEDDLDTNEVVYTNVTKKSSTLEYCWYTGRKCGAESCGTSCPIYRAVT